MPYAVLIGEEDPGFACGSYVIVQKYLHDLQAWNALSTEARNELSAALSCRILSWTSRSSPLPRTTPSRPLSRTAGRSKSCATTCPSGWPSQGEFGTYFIGYSRSPRTTELMIENMFVGRPPGNYDRILDFSRAVTGSLVFVPTATFLDNGPKITGRPAGGCPACDCAGPKGRTPRSIDPIGAPWFASHRIPQRRNPA